MIGAQIPGNFFLTRKEAEAMRPLLEVANRHRAVLFIHNGPRPGDAYPKVASDTDNARRRNGTLDMQASLSSVMVTLSLTDLLANYPDAMGPPLSARHAGGRAAVVALSQGEGIRRLQLVRPARDRGGREPVRRRAHCVRH